MIANQDSPGPLHAPFFASDVPIEGVVLQRAPFVAYEHGELTELFRPEWTGVFQEGETIDHLYAVWAPRGGKRDEWYFHKQTTDRYAVLVGSLWLGLYDGRKVSPSSGAFMAVVLEANSQENYSMVRIPPGVWHSLEWQSQPGLFINAKTPPYQQASPDKFRVNQAELPKTLSSQLDNR